MPEVAESPDEVAARLAWYQVISIQESVIPPAVFRPAQAHCWERKSPAFPRTELVATVASFADDRSLRDWVQLHASPEQVYALWEAIADLSRRFFLLDDDEKPDPKLVAAIRAESSARAVFVLALRLATT